MGGQELNKHKAPGPNENQNEAPQNFDIKIILWHLWHSNKPTYCCFIDLEKAFDWVNRDMTLFRLLPYGTEGHIYEAVKSLYYTACSCIKIYELFTDWFETNTGIRKGDNLSLLLLALFLNDLVY